MISKVTCEGTSVAKVMDADRERAWLVLRALPISIPGYSPETVLKARDHLAVALAEEREKARAPFLALADRMEHHDAKLCTAMADRKACQLDLASEVIFSLQAADFLSAADRIREAGGIEKS